jgi:chromosome partitioning protein
MEHRMKVVTILSQKGGSGKTTSTLALAGAAHAQSNTVVVLDIDPQAAATGWYTARKRTDLPEGLHVQPLQAVQLEEVIAACEAQEVDLVLIDTPPQSDNPAVQAAQLSDLILIVTKPSVMDLRAIQNTLRLAKVAGVHPYLLLNSVKPIGNRHIEATETMQKLGVDVLPTMLGDRVAFMDMLVEGRTPFEYDAGSAAAKESTALYQHVNMLLSKNEKGRAA